MEDRIGQKARSEKKEVHQRRIGSFAKARPHRGRVSFRARGLPASLSEESVLLLFLHAVGRAAAFLHRATECRLASAMLAHVHDFSLLVLSVPFDLGRAAATRTEMLLALLHDLKPDAAPCCADFAEDSPFFGHWRGGQLANASFDVVEWLPFGRPRKFRHTPQKA